MKEEIFRNYFELEKYLSQEEISRYFVIPTAMLNVKEFIEIYYQLGKSYSGIIYLWKDYLEKKYFGKEFYIMQRDAEILKKVGLKASDIWLNYDIYDNEGENEIVQYLRDFKVSNAVVVDVGIMGNIAMIIKSVHPDIQIEFLLSCNRYINGFLNSYITEKFNLNFMIAVVRSLELLYKEDTRPKYIKEIGESQRRNIGKILLSAREAFFKGISFGEKDMNTSLESLFKKYSQKLEDEDIFNGIIIDGYSIEKHQITNVEKKYEKIINR